MLPLRLGYYAEALDPACDRAMKFKIYSDTYNSPNALCDSIQQNWTNELGSGLYTPPVLKLIADCR